MATLQAISNNLAQRIDALNTIIASTESVQWDMTDVDLKANQEKVAVFKNKTLDTELQYLTALKNSIDELIHTTNEVIDTSSNALKVLIGT